MKQLTAVCFIITWLTIIFVSFILMAKYERLEIRQDRVIRMLQVDDDFVIVNMKEAGR